jgi:hypothetical protein
MATSKSEQATAKKPPRRKPQRVKEAKAPAKKKEKAKPIFGSAEFRIHRVLDNVTTRWRDLGQVILEFIKGKLKNWLTHVSIALAET